MRRRELAVREALGATRARVAGIVLRSAVVEVVSGAVAGTLIATVAVDYLNSLLWKPTLTTMGMTTLVAFLVIGLTVLVSSIGPVVSTWSRDLSRTLRV
jgi:ABC-type antimicrobial peptide transport system permease subunit